MLLAGRSHSYHGLKGAPVIALSNKKFCYTPIYTPTTVGADALLT